jgi:hypothetical protein
MQKQQALICNAEVAERYTVIQKQQALHFNAEAAGFTL